MSHLAEALCSRPEGTIISIEVIAGADRDQFPSGFNIWRKTIGCRVRAPASEGKANRAVISLISTILDIPESTLNILSGELSHQKRLFVRGLTKDQIISALSQNVK